MSVTVKLKKFHTVVQEAGGIRLGLQDILVKPGQSLAQLVDQDTQQIEGLTAAAAAARRAAVAAITGQPAGSEENSEAAEQPAVSVAGVAGGGGVKKGFLGKAAEVVGKVSSEITAEEPSQPGKSSGLTETFI